MKAKERRAKSEESFYSLMHFALCSLLILRGRTRVGFMARDSSPRKNFSADGGDYVGMIQREADFRFT